MRILFLCTGNSARSQMAEGFARALAAPSVEVWSAGTHPAWLHPTAVAVMRERGVDIAGQRSKGLEELPASAEVMITLCASAAAECPVYPGAARIEHWNLPDPAAADGGRDEVVAAFRDARDEIERRVQALLAELGAARPRSG